MIRPLDLLAPPRCAICGESGPLLCTACLRSLPLLDGPRCARCGTAAVRPVEECGSCRGRRTAYATAASALRYDGAGRGFVHAFKDGGLRGLAGPAAGIVALVVPAPAADAITWVPADPLRRVRRGYHPAQLLAEALGARWDLPSAPLLRAPLLRRPQRGLSRAQRRANVRDAFSAAAAVPAAVCLVDDVHTTGATLTAAARALRRGGARRVDAVTLARADRP